MGSESGPGLHVIKGRVKGLRVPRYVGVALRG